MLWLVTVMYEYLLMNHVFVCPFVVFRETSPQMVLNLLNAKENVDVPMNCPAAKKPQQIVAAQPKHSSKPKVHTHTHNFCLPTKKKEKTPATHALCLSG